jgi:hypothetical protein
MKRLLRHSYLTDGTLNDECLTCERSNCAVEYQRDKFEGEEVSIGFYTVKTPDKIRFKKGDLVEMLEYERVIPGIIVEVPQTVEEMKMKMKMKMKMNQYRHWYYSEDSYMVIIKNDEIHRNQPCRFSHKSLFGKYGYNDSIFTCYYPLSAFVFSARLSVSKLLREELSAEYHSFIKNTNQINNN